VQQTSVFNPTPTSHYLNITLDNVVFIFKPGKYISSKSHSSSKVKSFLENYKAIPIDRKILKKAFPKELRKLHPRSSTSKNRSREEESSRKPRATSSSSALEDNVPILGHSEKSIPEASSEAKEVSPTTEEVIPKRDTEQKSPSNISLIDEKLVSECDVLLDGLGEDDLPILIFSLIYRQR